MTKPRLFGPFGFRLLFWETWLGRFPEASQSQPRSLTGQGFWEGSCGLHPHPLNRVDLERLRRRPQKWPALADTGTHRSR